MLWGAADVKSLRDSEYEDAGESLAMALDEFV